MNSCSESPKVSLWQNPDFCRFFLGRFVTNVGDSLYSITIMWLVFDLTNSTFLTGVTSSLLLLPYMLELIAGPFVDRFRIKPLLIGSQLLQGGIMLVLFIGAYTGWLTIELILIAVPVLSLLNAVLAPIQTTLLPRIMRESQLSRGNSALTTITIGLDTLFEAVGGVLIAAFGVTALFVIDSITFGVATLLFAGIGIPTVNGGTDQAGESVVGSYIADLRTGIRLLQGSLLVEMLLLSAVANFAVGITLAILPAFGESLGGPHMYGLMLGALGAGRLLGSVAASYLTHVAYGPLTTGGYLLGGCLWATAVVTPSVTLTILLFGASWIPAGVNAVLRETITQKVFPENNLGCVSAIQGTISGLTLPVGSLIGGVLAGYVGVTELMILTALGFGITGIYFYLQPALRSLPPVTSIKAIDLTVSGS